MIMHSYVLPVINATIRVSRAEFYDHGFKSRFYIDTLFEETKVSTRVSIEEEFLSFCYKHNIEISDYRTGVEQYIDRMDTTIDDYLLALTDRGVMA